MLDPSPTLQFGDIARKWHALAERRREYLSELYRSGNWQRYFTEEAFLAQMRETVRNAEAWQGMMHTEAAAAPTPLVDARSSAPPPRTELPAGLPRMDLGSRAPSSRTEPAAPFRPAAAPPPASRSAPLPPASRTAPLPLPSEVTENLPRFETGVRAARPDRSEFDIHLELARELAAMSRPVVRSA